MCQVSSSSREGQRSLITRANGMHRRRPSQCHLASFNSCSFNPFHFPSNHRFMVALCNSAVLLSFVHTLLRFFGCENQSQQGPTAEVLAKVELVVVRCNSFCILLLIIPCAKYLGILNAVASAVFIRRMYFGQAHRLLRMTAPGLFCNVVLTHTELPVVPHKAVAEVSWIGHYRRGCEALMAERIHLWTEKWLEPCFLEWLRWSQWSPHHSCWV